MAKEIEVIGKRTQMMQDLKKSIFRGSMVGSES